MEQVTTKLDRLDRMVYSQIRSFDYLASQVDSKRFAWPTLPPYSPSPKSISAPWPRATACRDPIYGTMKFHEGMDFSAPSARPSTPPPTARSPHRRGRAPTATWYQIDHGFNYTTRYAHLSKLIARPGQQVRRGDLIGLVGNTGKSTGPHLHYEVRYRGAPQNPVNYYFYDLTPEQYDEI